MPTLLLLAVFALQASSRISGVVTDATALPLPGATVELDGRIVATADDHGVFEIIAPSGSSRLRVALDGFEPHNQFSSLASRNSASRSLFVDSKTASA
jgi:hypothetical protein